MNLNDAVSDERNWTSGSNLIESFLDDEVFFNIMNSNQFPEAELTSAARMGKVKASTAKLPDGEMALFYTSRNDERVKSPYGGMSLREALQMSMANKGVDGILLQSSGSAWIAIKTDTIRNLDLKKGQPRSRHQIKQQAPQK